MIFVSHNLHLSKIEPSDAPALVTCLSAKEIAEHTLRIPFPYTMQHAQQWIEDNRIFEEENGIVKNYAIRNATGMLIGCIGLHLNYGDGERISEFGYWLAKPYWNQGIMTDVVTVFCALAKAQYNMRWLEAYVFDGNEASKKVLLKAGFSAAQRVKNYYHKNGQNLDAVKFTKQL